MGGILWLASYPKSGNTWLRAFLTNYIRNLSAPVDINDLSQFAFIEATRKIFEQVSERPISELSDLDIYRLRPQVHRLIADKSRETRFVKTHCALTEIDGFPTVTPEVTEGAIYIIRNPLDVATSFCAYFQIEPGEAVQALQNVSFDLSTDDDRVHQYLGTWTEHVEGWLGAPGLKRHLVRYEDLVSQPFKTFGQIVAFLGLPKDKTRLQKAIRFSSFKVLAEQERKRGFKERPNDGEPFFRKGKSGSWRDVLSEEQVRRVVSAHGRVMERHGYLSVDGRLTC